jgi:DNA-binding PadR family transcriptional regulator
MQGRLPQLTHLQFVVIGALSGGEQPGRVVRDALARYGVNRSAPAFYQMMARLERDGLVEGWYGQVAGATQAVTERRYRATPAGAKAWAATSKFYERASAGAARTRWSDA